MPFKSRPVRSFLALILSLAVLVLSPGYPAYQAFAETIHGSSGGSRIPGQVHLDSKIEKPFMPVGGTSSGQARMAAEGIISATGSLEAQAPKPEAGATSPEAALKGPVEAGSKINSAGAGEENLRAEERALGALADPKADANVHAAFYDYHYQHHQWAPEDATPAPGGYSSRRERLAPHQAPAGDGRTAAQVPDAPKEGSAFEGMNVKAVVGSLTQRFMSVIALALINAVYYSTISQVVGGASPEQIAAHVATVMALGTMVSIIASPVNGRIVDKLPARTSGVLNVAMRVGGVMILPVFYAFGLLHNSPGGHLGVILEAMANSWILSALMTTDRAYITPFSGPKNVKTVFSISHFLYLLLTMKVARNAQLNGFLERQQKADPAALASKVASGLTALHVPAGLASKVASTLSSLGALGPMLAFYVAAGLTALGIPIVWKLWPDTYFSKSNTLTQLERSLAHNEERIASHPGEKESLEAMDASLREKIAKREKELPGLIAANDENLRRNSGEIQALRASGLSARRLPRAAARLALAVVMAVVPFVSANARNLKKSKLEISAAWKSVAQTQRLIVLEADGVSLAQDGAALRDELARRTPTWRQTVSNLAKASQAFLKRYWWQAAVLAVAAATYPFLQSALPLTGAILAWIVSTPSFKKLWSVRDLRVVTLMLAVGAFVYHPFYVWALPKIAATLAGAGSKLVLQGQLQGALFLGQIVSVVSQVKLPALGPDWTRRILVAGASAAAGWAMFSFVLGAGWPLALCVAAGTALGTAPHLKALATAGPAKKFLSWLGRIPTERYVQFAVSAIIGGWVKSSLVPVGFAALTGGGIFVASMAAGALLIYLCSQLTARGFIRFSGVGFSSVLAAAGIWIFAPHTAAVVPALLLASLAVGLAYGASYVALTTVFQAVATACAGVMGVLTGVQGSMFTAAMSGGLASWGKVGEMVHGFPNALALMGAAFIALGIYNYRKAPVLKVVDGVEASYFRSAKVQDAYDRIFRALKSLPGEIAAWTQAAALYAAIRAVLAGLAVDERVRRAWKAVRGVLAKGLETAKAVGPVLLLLTGFGAFVYVGLHHVLPKMLEAAYSSINAYPDFWNIHP